MAATKVRTSIWASQTLTASAGNTTSSWWICRAVMARSWTLSLPMEQQDYECRHRCRFRWETIGILD